MPVSFTFQDSIKLEAKRSYNALFWKTYNFLVTSSTATSWHARCGDLFNMVSPDWCSDRIQVRTRTPKQPGMQSIPNSTNHSNRWQRSFKDSLITLHTTFLMSIVNTEEEQHFYLSFPVKQSFEHMHLPLFQYLEYTPHFYQLALRLEDSFSNLLGSNTDIAHKWDMMGVSF